MEASHVSANDNGPERARSIIGIGASPEPGDIRQMKDTSRTWEIAARHDLSTIYDAAYLACTEVAPGQPGIIREFWTTDETLVRSLGATLPEYVRLVGTHT